MRCHGDLILWGLNQHTGSLHTQVLRKHLQLEERSTYLLVSTFLMAFVLEVSDLRVRYVFLCVCMKVVRRTEQTEVVSSFINFPLQPMAMAMGKRYWPLCTQPYLSHLHAPQVCAARHVICMCSVPSLQKAMTRRWALATANRILSYLYRCCN